VAGNTLLDKIFRHKATGRFRTLDRQASMYLVEEMYGWVGTHRHVGRQTDKKTGGETKHIQTDGHVGKLTDGRMDGWNGCMND
jgi:hypothetical protein